MKDSRRVHLSLKGLWKYRLDPAQRGMAEGWFLRRIDSADSLALPGCVQQLSALAGDYPPPPGLHNGYLGDHWLETTVSVPADSPACATLSIGAAPYAHAWLNGQYLGHTADPLTPTQLDASAAIRPGCENRVTLLVHEQDVGLMGGWRFEVFCWSGVHAEPVLQLKPACHISSVRLLENKAQSAVFAVVVKNTSGEAFSGALEAFIDEKPVFSLAAELAAGAEKTLTAEICVTGFDRWSPESPALHEVCFTLGGDAETLKTGFRVIEAKDDQLLLDGRPLFLAGAGEEYFSPTIAPMTDRELIRRRYRRMREAGFNFRRCHTHQPTQEELEIADEVGLLISSEVSVISNFNLTEPFDRGLDALARHVDATSRHPSLLAYCLGNEGAQLMSLDEEQRERARKGYALIHAHTDNQLAMICFGIQGEVAGVPNDIVTPHLWDEDFTASYSGLSAMPWESLRHMDIGGPLVIHEYGKFGVWPDLNELSQYPADGYVPYTVAQVKEALTMLQLEPLQEALVKNSRLLSERCTRIAIEAARRQPRVRGYVLWSFFRMGHRNAGIVGDMGLHADPVNCVLARSQAAAALLIDRDFDSRCLVSGAQADIGVFLSNYGADALCGAAIEWRFEAEGMEPMCGRLSASAVPGECVPAGSIRFVPAATGCMRAAKLILSLPAAGWQNSWDFWVLPAETRTAFESAVTDFEDVSLARRFGTVCAVSTLARAGSVLRGCRSWICRDDAEALKMEPRRLLVTDRLDAAARACAARGMNVLVLLRESEWMCPPLRSGVGVTDMGTLYTSFRAGWDRGLLATVAEDSPLLDGFPHEGFCDLNFFRLIHEAPALSMEALRKALPDVKPLVRGFLRVPKPANIGVVVQDVNAARALAQPDRKVFWIREQAYLAETEMDGGRVVLCTMPLTDSPEGRYLLKSLVKKLAE